MSSLKLILVCCTSVCVSFSISAAASDSCTNALKPSSADKQIFMPFVSERTDKANALILKKAIIFAKKKHAGIFRKFDGKPYITHPIQVLKIVRMYSDDIEVHVAAVLHDVLEDTDTNFQELVEEFGISVANLVRGLSSDEAQIEIVGKTIYLSQKMEAMDLRTLLIKLADRLHNTSDFQDATPKFISNYRAETNYILALIANRTDLLFPHNEIIGNIYNAMLEGEKAYRGRAFSEKKYEGLKRQITSENYSLHPTRVAKTLKRLKAPVDVQIAGYLKDAMEKGQGTSYMEIKEQFGKGVADIVQELTVDPLYRAQSPSREVYEAERTLLFSNEALLIRLAGRYDNLKEIFEQNSSDHFKEYIKETRNMLSMLGESSRLLESESEYLISKIKWLFYYYPKK